jgi:predicted dienelactone hydrolase
MPPPAGHPATLGQLTLPEPTGPDRIGTVSLHLVDKARTDPWLLSHPIREIMIQIWYPATTSAGSTSAPWLSPGAVPHFEQSLGVPAGVLRWPTTHAHVGAPVDRGRCGRPVVLYSPGAGSDRTISTVLVEELASHGYVVVTIDHTHDAGEVEFPGGRVETLSLPGEINDSVIAQALAVREADSRFVLDQLAAINAGRNPDADDRPLPRGLRGALDLSRTGMFGHSLGGATAAATMHDDPRVKAGINMDGSLLSSSATAGSDRPFLLLGSDQGGPEDPSWDEFWKNQRGWKRELTLTGSTHLSFTDFEVLYPQGGPIVGLTSEQVTQVIGTLDPLHAVRAERAYVRAFFDLHLRNQDDHLFSGASPRYPQIHFVR